MESSGRLNVPAGHQLTFTAPESRSVLLSLLLAVWQELLIVQILTGSENSDSKTRRWQMACRVGVKNVKTGKEFPDDSKKKRKCSFTYFNCVTRKMWTDISTKTTTYTKRIWKLTSTGTKERVFFSKCLTFNYHNMWFCHHLYEVLQEVPLKHFGTPVTLKLCYKNAFDSIF